jgi:hypothetical protein
MNNVAAWSNSKVLARAFMHLGQGVLPLAQWGGVFSGPEFFGREDLRCKAFSVWFPTMVEFLRHRDEYRTLQKELVRRGIDIADLSSREEKMAQSFQECLSLFERDEQLFLNDRRLQNVHGHLSLLFLEMHTIRWFDRDKKAVESANLSSEEYSAAVSKFYRSMQASEVALLQRLLNANESARLSLLYESELQPEKHLFPLGRRLGVFA